jgi:hypothetical protein
MYRYKKMPLKESNELVPSTCDLLVIKDAGHHFLNISYRSIGSFN